MKRPIIIANWKLFFSPQQVEELFQIHEDELRAMTTSATIIICPEVCLLASIAPLAKDYGVATGSAWVSSVERGPYTGQISVQSLAQLGVDYCLVGHQEVQAFLPQEKSFLKEKFALLNKYEIVPIVIFSQLGKRALEQQITIITKALSQTALLIIALEPSMAVNKKQIPSIKKIIHHISMLKEWICHLFPKAKIFFVYGGSVNSESLSLFNNSPFDGFLLGRAGTDFQQLKKIVSWAVKQL